MNAPVPAEIGESSRLFTENDVAVDFQPWNLVASQHHRRSAGLLELGDIDTVDTSDLDSIRV